MEMVKVENVNVCHSVTVAGVRATRSVSLEFAVPIHILIKQQFMLFLLWIAIQVEYATMASLP